MIDVTAEAVEALVATQRASLPSCPDSVVDASICRLARIVNQAQAALTAGVAEWDTRDLYALDGSRSASAWIARETGCTTASAKLVVRRAQRLRTMPAAAEAFGNGDLSTDKVDLLCTANADGRQELFARDEHLLVSEAKRLHAEDFRRAVNYWIAAADDAKAEQKANHVFESRHLNFSKTTGGKMVISGHFDPVGGAVFTTELNTITRQLFEEDWVAAKELWGDDTRADRLARTDRQRRCDAAVIMAERSAMVTADHGPVRPLVTIHLGEDAARKTLCELDDGTVLTPGQVRHWIADADFERIIFGPRARVIEVSVRTRLFRGGLRRAIEIRDRHCTHPGCRVPAHLCNIDHISEYAAGGQTTQRNGRLLCPAHNHQRPGRTTHPPGRQPPNQDDDDPGQDLGPPC